MRLAFSIIYAAFIVALAICAIIAYRSGKRDGGSVAALLAALIPPVAGNMLIISSSNLFVSAIGWHVYLLGMDVVMFALIGFTFRYCKISWPAKWQQVLIYLLLCLDMAQVLCNPITGHAFGLESITFDQSLYFICVPRLGQAIHRLVVYGVFIMVLIIFLVKTIRSPKIYSERFTIILLVMVFVGGWETFYIFSRTPVDRSMTGFAVFGILVFYFALYYRPMRLLDRMLSNVVQQMHEALFFFDAMGRCIWANDYGLNLAKTQNEDFDTAANIVNRRFAGDIPQEDDYTLQHVEGSGGDARYFVLERHTIRDNKGRIDGHFLSIRDNTEQQQSLQKKIYDATHDKLTGLYTKDYLFVQVEEMLKEHPNGDYLILFVNVSEFKVINDIFGYSFGDYALQRVADWLRYELPEPGVYGRLAGDTFGVCIPADNFDEKQIEQSLEDFIVSDGTIEHQMLIHLGVYQVLNNDMDVYLMFDRARIALSTIKNAYHTHIAWYDREMRERVLWNQHISSQLQDAIEQRQIIPYLQPMVDSEGRVVGAEALVRWIHPEDGFLPPSRFVPAFEKNGMIADVDRYMWRCACEILARWREEGKDLFISVNISPKDFYFMDVAAELRHIVKKYNVDPSKLRIEITETTMMTDIENRVRILNELQKDGFCVEMDDFGSGYSSLNMLKDMPVDLLKIDMVFLNESRDDQKAHTILHNIISLSDELGITTLTEGVETRSQYQMLSRMGCSLFQGYYFAKPMPVEEFETFCADKKILHEQDEGAADDDADGGDGEDTIRP